MTIFARFHAGLFCLAAAALPGSARASSAFEGEPPEEGYTQTLSFGLTVFKFDYQELVPLPFKSTENGTLPGVSLAYRLEPRRSPWRIQAGVDFTDASTAFDGSTQAGTPVLGNTPNTLVNAEGDLGLALLPGAELYSGLGYRYWKRGSARQNADGSVDYAEKYSWFYLPVGVRARAGFGRFEAGLDLSMLLMFAGRIEVQLADLDPALNSPEADLGSRTSYRASLPLSYAVSPRLKLTVAPWYVYSRIGQSPQFLVTMNGVPIAAGFEPNSRTRQYGATLAAGFQF